MTSFTEAEVDVSRNREIVDRREEASNKELSTAKSLKRKRRDSRSSPSSDRRSSPRPASNEEVDRKRKKSDSPSPTSSDVRSKQPTHDNKETDEHRETSTKSLKRNRSKSRSPNSMDKRSEKRPSSPSSSHKRHKHKRRSDSRERHHDSGKHSADSSRSNREDLNTSSSRKRSYSSRDKDISSSSYDRDSHDDKKARKSTERIERASGTTKEDATNGSKALSGSSFKIPRKKHRVEDEDVSYRKEKKPKISASLLKEIRDLLYTEDHHVISKDKDANGDVAYVEWCYYYLNPSIPGHITGGQAHLHHLCRVCKRTCLHLLGTYGTGSRKCLVCAANERGWREDEVPSWYFHETCEYCKNDTRRGGGRGGGRGGNRGWQNQYRSYRPGNNYY